MVQRCRGVRVSSRRKRSYVINTVFNLVILLSLSKLITAQLGTSICICSPAIYEIRLNFSGTCENTALLGEGITTSDCAIEPFQNKNVTDEVPVTAGSIDILELDADLVLLTQSSRFGTFGNGDTIRFASISNEPTKINITSYPSALQISIIGNNQLGETLFFAGLVIYDTDCSRYPLILEGSSIGWITFVSYDTQTFSAMYVKAICILSHTNDRILYIFR
jgi:hypothetical protein